MASGPSRSKQVTVAGATAEIGTRLAGSFTRRNLISTFLGASVGFGVGVAFHALWRALVDLYTRRNDTDRLMVELANLKQELMDVRRMLNLNEDKSWKASQLVSHITSCDSRKLLQTFVLKSVVLNFV
ncbi:unnamed protein product [Echinostoma caproni]|uniref:Mitofilin n=1 Tax=Echinostoma caproni TaxID=27848 RepID=A0A183A3D9_9TREM|nr:unnamed protein product [Echinostoma caproni]